MSRHAPLRRPGDVRRYGGGRVARGLSEGAEQRAMHAGDLGLIAHPGMSMREIVSAAGSGGTGNEGLRVLLGEGTWHFGAAGWNLGRSRVHLVALSPGRTVFKRSAAAGNTNSMVQVRGDQVILEGIRFSDADEAGFPAVKFYGTFCELRRCFFDDCYLAARSYAGSSNLRMEGNTVRKARDPSRTVYMAGASVDNLVSGWMFESTHNIVAPTIYADDTVGRTVFANNLTGSLGVINFKGLMGNIDSGNTGTITRRP